MPKAAKRSTSFLRALGRRRRSRAAAAPPELSLADARRDLLRAVWGEDRAGPFEDLVADAFAGEEGERPHHVGLLGPALGTAASALAAGGRNSLVLLDFDGARLSATGAHLSGRGLQGRFEEVLIAGDEATLPRSGFDLLVVADGLAALGAPGTLFLACAEALAPGGRLVVYEMCRAEGEGAASGPVALPWTAEEWRVMPRLAGLHLIAEHDVTGHLVALVASRRSNWERVPAMISAAGARDRQALMAAAVSETRQWAERISGLREARLMTRRLVAQRP